MQKLHLAAANELGFWSLYKKKFLIIFAFIFTYGHLYSSNGED